LSTYISQNISVRLDLLRGIAAQAVLVEHILTTAGAKGVFIGSFGVVVFFILSGFLIHITTMNAYEKGKFSLSYYFSKRFFRIFTLYIPLVILCFTIDNIVQYFGLPQADKVIQNSTLQNFIGSFFMLQQNVFSEVSSQILGMESFRLKPYGSARPFWTVAIEWWIYIAYGFLFAWYFSEEKLPRVFSLAGLLFGFSLVVVAFNTISGIGHNLSFIWVLGAVVGHYYCKGFFDMLNDNKKLLYFTMVMLAVFFLARIVHMKLSPMFIGPIPYDMVNVIIFTLFFICFLLLPNTFIDKGWMSRFARFIGEISYALYLIHFTVLSVLYGLGWFEHYGFAVFIASFFISNLLAMVLYFSIDRFHAPLWKRYWVYKNPKPQEEQLKNG